MPEQLPHFYFRNAQEGEALYRQKVRFSGSRNEEENEDDDNQANTRDYSHMRESFIRSRNNFITHRENREERRNPQLNLPVHANYISITFFDAFDINTFEIRYRLNFGLSPVKYGYFNTVGLFAIVDDVLFARFFREIDNFIVTENHDQGTYNPDIKFIKEFDLLTTENIITYSEIKPHIVLELVDNVEMFQQVIDPLENSLEQYLSERRINHLVDYRDSRVELFNVSQSVVEEIANNFDIIQRINSYNAGVIRPSPFNLPERSFGFTISNADQELPIIGIIDTGISRQTPLADIIVNEDNNFDITNTSSVTDSVDHGSAVATLACLGDRLYPNHRGDFESDAKVLSIKVLDAEEGFIPEGEVIRLIRQANQRYGTQIFTLTIGYNTPKTHNDIVSEYAYSLDKLTSELNILIFISIGNNTNLFDNNTSSIVRYPEHFDIESTNLFVPAESMNNITVGAAAGNFENNDNHCVSPDGSFPAIYTRTHYINWSDPLMKQNRVNPRLYKPDICLYGGDYDSMLGVDTAGLKVLSARSGVFFERQAGTSYAAPLAANLAAKLIKTYPQLSSNMQTVKALILNAAHNGKIDDRFNSLTSLKAHGVYGNGIPEIEASVFSNENRVTFILEDSIIPENIRSYALNIPDYLLNVDRQNSLLKVQATLCFKFTPLRNNHLAYCPIHMAFGVFRNLPLESYATDDQGRTILDSRGRPIPTGINNNKTGEYQLVKSWSQDYYYKPKLLSNAQKVDFTISKRALREENCTFKIVINSKFHKLLSQNLRTQYNSANPFSLVITLEESPIKGVNTGRLYNEIRAINTLQAINTVDITLEANNES